MQARKLANKRTINQLKTNQFNKYEIENATIKPKNQPINQNKAYKHI